MPRRETQIRVTEPTMSNGVWQLAAFEWITTATFTHHEIEDSYISWGNQQIVEKTGLRVQYDDWLTSMPAVEKMQEPLQFYEMYTFTSDTHEMRARARGFFALSDDEAATERMLALVNTDKIEHMQPLFWVGDLRLRMEGSEERVDRVDRFIRNGVVLDEQANVDWSRARESLLRPGTADNDVNSEFTTGPLLYRERYSVNWTDWRRVYGTISEDGGDGVRALLEAYPEMRNEVPPPPVVPQLTDDRRERANRAMAQLIDAAMRSPAMDPAATVIIAADNRPIRDIIMPLPETPIDPVHHELRRLEREYWSRRVIEAQQERGNAATRGMRAGIERDMAERWETIAAQVLNAFTNGAGAAQDTNTGDGSGPPSVSVQSDSGSTGETND